MATLPTFTVDDIRIAREIAIASDDAGARFFTEAQRKMQDAMILEGKCDDHWIIQAIAAGVAVGRRLLANAPDPSAPQAR